MALRKVPLCMFLCLFLTFALVSAAQLSDSSQDEEKPVIFVDQNTDGIADVGDDLDKAVEFLSHVQRARSTGDLSRRGWWRSAWHEYIRPITTTAVQAVATVVGKRDQPISGLESEILRARRTGDLGKRGWWKNTIHKVGHLIGKRDQPISGQESEGNRPVVILAAKQPAP